MEFKHTYQDFVCKLASDAPVPGGGGASALVGALGVALGTMAANISLKRKQTTKILKIKERAEALQNQLLNLIEADAVAFLPLSSAYKLPTSTKEQKQHKEKAMEESLRTASKVPLLIMRGCCEAILLHEELEAFMPALLQSDIGVGVVLCKAALQGAALNVFCNTKLMQDTEFADRINEEASNLLKQNIHKADALFERVNSKLARD